MKFSLIDKLNSKAVSDCLVLPVFAKTKAEFFNNTITKASKGGDFGAKFGEMLMLHDVSDGSLSCKRLLLVGCGPKKKLDTSEFLELCHKINSRLLESPASHIVSILCELELKDKTLDLNWKLRTASRLVLASLYKFDQFKSKTGKSKAPTTKNYSWYSHQKPNQKLAKQAFAYAAALNMGTTRCKDLANMPANICTPKYLSKQAQELSRKHAKLKLKILDKATMQKLGMGAMLAVAQGSANPPQMIIMEYSGGPKNQKPIALVGKGITFDTGGNSLKPAASMIGMKYDMCGAATVMGAMEFAANMQLPLNIVGVIAAAENMPGSTAARPDDIVTTMQGITVEILNTDAEGRLVLSDALCYVQRYNPEVIIDFATLTGACLVALGSHHAGLMANDQKLADALIKAGNVSGEKCWQLPLTSEYQKQIDSNVADIANIGGPEAGTITAACFLSRFVEKARWAHLDIAGVAARFTGKDRSASAKPLGLVAEYLLAQL